MAGVSVQLRQRTEDESLPLVAERLVRYVAVLCDRGANEML